MTNQKFTTNIIGYIGYTYSYSYLICMYDSLSICAYILLQYWGFGVLGFWGFGDVTGTQLKAAGRHGDGRQAGGGVGSLRGCLCMRQTSAPQRDKDGQGDRMQRQTLVRGAMEGKEKLVHGVDWLWMCTHRPHGRVGTASCPIGRKSE